MLPISQSRCQGKFSQKNFTTRGKGEQENPIKTYYIQRHLQPLLLRTLTFFTKLMPADGAAEFAMMHQLPKLELLLQHRRICSQGLSASSLGSRGCGSLPHSKSQVTDLFYHYCASHCCSEPCPQVPDHSADPLLSGFCCSATRLLDLNLWL